MAAAQPIAFASNSDSNDLLMSQGSYTGQNGSFNPASYTRRFIGSPLSFRAASFGSRFYPGVSPGQLLGPLDPNDFRFGKISSSIESDRGSIVNALNVFERQEQLCRDYQCCGVNLTDMHALVDHFEECHVVVVDPFTQPYPAYRQPVNASANASTSSASLHQQPSYYSDSTSAPAPTYNQGSFDPDDMELDGDMHSAPSSGAPSPPDTPVSTPLSSYPTSHNTHHITPHQVYSSQSVSPRPTPISAFDTTTVLPTRTALAAFPSTHGHSRANPALPEGAFNAYSGYSDYSALLPGTVPSSSTDSQSTPTSPRSSQQGHGQGQFAGSPYGSRSGCVPPALLLNTSVSEGATPMSTPGSSRVASPAPGSALYSSGSTPISPTNANSAPPTPGGSTPRASTTLSRPASSLLLSKPFKCPKPNCNKSYKQANGLKYHMTHGSCNFAPPKDLEQIQAILASKREEAARDGTATVGADGTVGLSEMEMREVEREAERRLRPYACGVGDCQRRYKNMNGLRYHYQHSGDHGSIGLALLASGQHECLQHTRAGHSSRHVTPSVNNNSPAPHGSNAPASHSNSNSMNASPPQGYGHEYQAQQPQQSQYHQQQHQHQQGPSMQMYTPMTQ